LTKGESTFNISLPVSGNLFSSWTHSGSSESNRWDYSLEPEPTFPSSSLLPVHSLGYWKETMNGKMENI